MLADALTLLTNAEGQPNWARLGEHLPYEWIERAVAETGTASIRRRRLPAEQVVWLVVALALCRHQSISEVVDNLDLALPDPKVPFTSKSAVSQARKRLGEAPLKWLFQTSARAWSSQDKEAYQFEQLQLLAMDGTILRTPDSLANREHFGAQSYASRAVASYPQVRGVTLMSIPTHLVVDAAFGSYAINEMQYAKTLVPRIPDHSLTVLDKGFLAAEILCGLTSQGENRHFLIPAKSNTKWKVIEGRPEDAIVRMRVSTEARRKTPTLPHFWQARAIETIDSQGRKKVLLTSLTDRKRFKASDIVACYARRWEIETSYRELKQAMLGMGATLTLRSKTVDGIQQEIWGALTAYNLIRLEISKAALEAKCEPTDISFIRALHTIQYELQWAAVTRAQGKLPGLLRRLRDRLVTAVNEKRPGRTCERVVKSKPHRYSIRVLKKNVV